MSIIKKYYKYTKKKKGQTLYKKTKINKTIKNKYIEFNKQNKKNKNNKQNNKHNKHNKNYKTNKNKKINNIKGGASVQEIVAYLYWKKKHDADLQLQLGADIISTEDRGGLNYKPGKVPLELTRSRHKHYNEDVGAGTNAVSGADMPTEIVGDFKAIGQTISAPKIVKLPKIKF